MIRKLQEKDINRVADIWLDCNLKAHDFISEQYWKKNFELVKEMFPQAEVYVYEDEDSSEIQGFIGMSDDYIEGIFVWHEIQSHGIGKQLLDYVKSIHNKLTLRVYQKNAKAIRFYQRENFEIRCENKDENTGEREYLMAWEKSKPA